MPVSDPPEDEKTPSSSSDSEKQQEALQSQVKTVTGACQRMMQNLQQAQTIVRESQNLQQELYQRYKTDFQFQHYPPTVRNPKAILRALTQDSEPSLTQEEGN